MIRLALDEAAFRDLVAGNVVKLRTTTNLSVELLLSDIGWSRMLTAVEDAIRTAGAQALARDAEPTF
jgi:hypothetical protein